MSRLDWRARTRPIRRRALAMLFKTRLFDVDAGGPGTTNRSARVNPKRPRFKHCRATRLTPSRLTC